MTMRPLTRRLIAALLLVLLTSCYSWRPTTISPARIIAEEEPSTVRVTLADGTQLTLDDPTIRSDSIVSKEGEAQVVVSDVSRVELRLLSVAKTIGIIVAVPVGLVLYFASVCAGSRCR